MLAVEAGTRWELVVEVHSLQALWPVYWALGFRIKRLSLTTSCHVVSRGDAHTVMPSSRRAHKETSDLEICPSYQPRSYGDGHSYLSPYSKHLPPARGSRR